MNRNKNLYPIQPNLVVDHSPFSHLLNLIVPLTEDQNTPKHIVLFGGSTAIEFYKYVLDILENNSINFSNLHFWFTDERMVNEESASSNYGEFKRHFANKVPSILNENLHPIYGIESGNKSEIDIEIQRISNKTTSLLAHNSEGIPSFDLVILGMGADGHTASLFPHNFDSDDGELYVPAVHPETKEKRISMSLKLINAAKSIALVATGEGKKEKIKEILPVYNTFVKKHNLIIKNNTEHKSDINQAYTEFKQLRDVTLQENASPLVVLSSSIVNFLFDDKAADSEKKLSEYK